MIQFHSSTSPTVTTMMILFLTTILTVTSNEEIYEGSYQSLAPGYSYGYVWRSETEKFSSTPCLLKCAMLSLRSNSEIFSYNNVSRVCENYSPKNIMTVVRTKDNNVTSFFKNSRWIKTYALSMGAGSKVYNSFMNKGKPSSWKVDKCNGSFCPNFFRHPILDYWENLPVDEVKLVIYKKQKAVVTMIFDGRNSSLETWFSHANLKSSPWNDLSSEIPDKFSIAGVFNLRRFYITNHGGCSIEAGWLAIIGGSIYCLYDKMDHYPSIRYSPTNSKVVWNNTYELADSLAIFISLRQ